ncbi:type IV pilus biogenesis/stability protein PilW [Sulfuriflexus mobilis]|uniref:type IV pilus biogenesis/stability protein PilW n=1 Tax=Sulfuriflexus mobilis TaxID=1811807 RepID=UPI000F846753|nr:type IV pilus biogenesis/stability protein PilW [Sulfuriflexus mobilis]
MKIITSLFFYILIVLSGAGLVACSTTTGGGDAEGELRVAPEGDKLAATNVKLGVGYMQKGSYEYALAKFRRAIEIDSSYPDAHYAIALLYDRLGRPEAAKEHFEKAISLNPSYSDAYNAYAAFLCRKEDYEAADANFQKALTNPLYRTPQLVLINAGICSVNAKNYDRADGYFRKVLQADSRQPVALYQMAKLNYESGRYLQARAYIQRFSSVSRPTPQSLWLGVRIERSLGDKGAAASYALTLRKQFPDSDETRLLRESGGR